MEEEAAEGEHPRKLLLLLLLSCGHLSSYHASMLWEPGGEVR